MLGADVVVLLAVAAGGLLLGRLVRLPAIPAYLIAGVLAGPGVLHWVSRTETIEHLAELGVALLLFGVGIEFSLDRLRLRLARMAATGMLQVAGTAPRPAHGPRSLGSGRVVSARAPASVGQYFTRRSDSGFGNAGAIPGTINSAPKIVARAAAVERVRAPIPRPSSAAAAE